MPKLQAGAILRVAHGFCPAKHWMVRFTAKAWHTADLWGWSLKRPPATLMSKNHGVFGHPFLPAHERMCVCTCVCSAHAHAHAHMWQTATFEELKKCQNDWNQQDWVRKGGKDVQAMPMGRCNNDLEGINKLIGALKGAHPPARPPAPRPSPHRRWARRLPRSGLTAAGAPDGVRRSTGKYRFEGLRVITVTPRLISALRRRGPPCGLEPAPRVETVNYHCVRKGVRQPRSSERLSPQLWVGPVSEDLGPARRLRALPEL